MLLMLLTFLGATACRALTTATPSITLATGSYVMPTSTTITDSTSGASIEWCYVNSGACTPATSYTGSIYVDPTSTETICAYATASEYTQSSTVCNYYTAEATSDISFSYSGGQVTMSTTLAGASIFYTLDGSTATEASIEYTGNPVTVAPGTTINAAAVLMTSGGNTGVTVQNGQVTSSNWKTVLSSSSTQSSPYVSNYITPNIDYGPGNGTCANGVCGIPTQIGMVVNQTLPSAIGTGTTTNFHM